MKTVCLAILNYNGRKHLEHLLPTAIAAAKTYQGRCSVLALDNRSTEPGDVDWINDRFPAVEVIVAPENDYLFAYNWLVENRHEEILIFLNNDLKLHPDFVRPLARHFFFDDVFAVSATSRDWDDTVFTCGPAQLKSHHGIYEWDYQRENQKLCHTLFASGGFMAVDRKKFLHLSGFNRLFWPGYAEDLDLGFRAWRRGWRSIFGTGKRCLASRKRELGQRNGWECGAANVRASLLFQWLSLPPAAGWVERSSFTCLTAFRKTLKGQCWWPKIWLKTWMEWQKVHKRYSGLMAAQELQAINRLMAEPVRKPDE